VGVQRCRVQREQRGIRPLFANNVAGYFTDSGVGQLLDLQQQRRRVRFVVRERARGGREHRDAEPGRASALTAANLAAYDGVFFAGGLGSGSANADAIEAYIRSGGSAYVAAGTGAFGSAAGEAAGWNPLSESFRARVRLDVVRAGADGGHRARSRCSTRTRPSATR
jgi:hypothetical protein